ncbi:MAG: riboflavin synthase [Campylobacterales bacterium]|nr:riboflavin synthase [Campylobacterales bacterium]
MFTGLIREIATVKAQRGNRLTIDSKYTPKLGDSIAINGVCLTVVKVEQTTFDVELGSETREIIGAEKFQGRVHMEPAMQANDRFEGHIVQGHIDAIGVIKSITQNDNSVDIVIGISKEHIINIIPKGSVSIDGVSLTINDVFEDSFRLTIIPHTIKETLIGTYKVGDKINIETDLFARYISHILAHKNGKKNITWSDIERMHSLY